MKKKLITPTDGLHANSLDLKQPSLVCVAAERKGLIERPLASGGYHSSLTRIDSLNQTYFLKTVEKTGHISLIREDFSFVQDNLHVQLSGLTQ